MPLADMPETSDLFAVSLCRAPHALSSGAFEVDAPQPSNAMGIYALLYSAHSAHSFTHHSELTLLLHHAGHGHGGAGVGAHDRVVRTEEVDDAAAGTASSESGSGVLAEKDRRRPGSLRGVRRNVAAIRPWRARKREKGRKV